MDQDASMTIEGYQKGWLVGLVLAYVDAGLGECWKEHVWGRLLLGGVPGGASFLFSVRNSITGYCTSRHHGITQMLSQGTR